MTVMQVFPCHSSQHYSEVIRRLMVSQITSLTIVCSTVYSGADQRKHQSSTSLAFVRGIHQWSVNSLHKGPVMQKMFPFDDIIMRLLWKENAFMTVRACRGCFLAISIRLKWNTGQNQIMGEGRTWDESNLTQGLSLLYLIQGWF